MRQALVSFPSLHPKLWLDEWNVNAGFDPRMSGTNGAAFVAAVLSTAQADGLDRSAFYDATDDSPVDNFGLLTETGAPKPDFSTFCLLARPCRTSLAGQHDASARHLTRQGRGRSSGLALHRWGGERADLQLCSHRSGGNAAPAPGHPTQAPGDGVDHRSQCHPYAIQVARIDTDPLESEGTISGAKAIVHLPANGQSVSLVQLTPDS